MTFSPHGLCLAWDQYLLPAMLLGHGLTALAYVAIPLLLTSRRHGGLLTGHPGVRVLFAAFIFSCAITHAFTLLTIYVPAYWPAAIASLVTGAISVMTAAALPYLLRHPIPPEA